MSAALAVRVLAVALVAKAAFVTSATAQGQPLRATGAQDLNFGIVFPGVQERVSRTDPANAGRYELRGRRLAEVRITFTLPPALTASGGRTIPLVFGPNDGGRNFFNNATNAQAFDPRVPLVTRLGLGRLYIFLGGTLNPSPTTTAGNYQATITLTSAYTGN